MSKLPTPCELLKARDWLMLGAPAAARHYDAKESVKILLQLISALPTTHLPVYCYGTTENRIAMLACDKEEETKDS